MEGTGNERVCVIRLAICILLMCWTLLSPFSSSTASAQDRQSINAKVIHVQDGDSFTIVLNDGSREKLILYGVDCPELEQDFGQQALEFSKKLCMNKSIKIESKGKDRHGRMIAVVRLDNSSSSLNAELLKNGLAWWSDKFAPEAADFKALDSQARQDKLGLWSMPGPIAPWIFRNGQKSVEAKLK